MRQTLTISATVAVLFSVFYSVIFTSAVSTAISICGYYQPAEKEENICMDSCCGGMGTSADCCCYFSEIPVKNETLLSYESFGKSIYSCAVHTLDTPALEKQNRIDCETQVIPEYIVYYIFRPPKAQA